MQLRFFKVKTLLNNAFNNEILIHWYTVFNIAMQRLRFYAKAWTITKEMYMCEWCACLVLTGSDMKLWQHIAHSDNQKYRIFQLSHPVSHLKVLSTNYLASEDCMEQYNIALCCNRQAHRNILAPFFVETVSLPTYMGLVQYADCRYMDALKKINSV